VAEAGPVSGAVTLSAVGVTLSSRHPVRGDPVRGAVTLSVATPSAAPSPCPEATLSVGGRPLPVSWHTAHLRAAKSSRRHEG